MNDAGTMETVTVEQLLAQSGWLQRLAGGLLGSREAADDAVQEALITAWQRPPADRTRLRGWLGTVVTNRARSQARGDRRRSRLAAAAGAEPAPASHSPEEVVAGLELQRLVASLLLELPEGHRQVIHMRFFEELDSPTIAARLGIAPATARWRLQAALGELRTRLDQRDGEGGRKWRRALAGLAPTLTVARRPLLWLLGTAGLASVTALGVVVGASKWGDRGARAAGPSATSAGSAARGDGAGARPPRPPGSRPPALHAAAGGDTIDPSLPPAQLKTAPFAGLRWLAGDVPEVLVGDSWARLLAIDGLDAASIVAFCKQRYPARRGMSPDLLWRKRFSEDLVEVLDGMGHQPREMVSLTIQRPGSTRPESVAAPMTVENRRQLWQANMAAMGGLPADNPVDPWTRVSPYTGIAFRGEAIDVEVEGQWYRLLSIAGVSTERLVAAAKSRFGERWKVRIAEDPVEVLTAATGNSPGRTVDLVLETKTPTGARRIEKRGVALTEENRQRVKRTWRP